TSSFACFTMPFAIGRNPRFCRLKLRGSPASWMRSLLVATVKPRRTALPLLRPKKVTRCRRNSFRRHGHFGNIMRVLVTGASGFLGRCLVQTLLEQGHRVRCFVRTGRNSRVLDPRVETCSGSLEYPKSCQTAVDGCNVVYHLAAALTGAP